MSMYSQSFNNITTPEKITSVIFYAFFLNLTNLNSGMVFMHYINISIFFYDI